MLTLNFDTKSDLIWDCGALLIYVKEISVWKPKVFANGVPSSQVLELMWGGRLEILLEAWPGMYPLPSLPWTTWSWRRRRRWRSTWAWRWWEQRRRRERIGSCSCFHRSSSPPQWACPGFTTQFSPPSYRVVGVAYVALSTQPWPLWQQAKTKSDRTGTAAAPVPLMFSPRSWRLRELTIRVTLSVICIIVFNDFTFKLLRGSLCADEGGAELLFWK